MSKNTVTVSNSNTSDVSIDAMVKALSDETASKEKGEKSGSKRRAIALQLVLTYPDTHAEWKRRVEQLGTQIEDQRDEARSWIAALVGADDYEGSDRSNHIRRAINTITFAVDMVRMNYASDITFNSKGGAFVNGNSTMAQAIWTHYDWSGKKNMAERDVSEQITIVPRNNDRDAGKVSWSMLEDFMRARAGRKQSARSTARTVSTNKPLEALTVISDVAANADASHFNTTAGRAKAVDTAEDVLALALDGDLFKGERDYFAKAFEQVREKLGVKRGNALTTFLAKIAAKAA